MRKFLLSAIVLISSLFVFTLSAKSQNFYQNALGLRAGNGLEVSYQKNLQAIHRLELNLGIDKHSSFDVSGVYQWVFDLSKLYPGFNWYTGPSAYMLFSKDFNCGVGGQIGIEYNFYIPLQISLDFNPTLLFADDDDYDHFYTGLFLSVRYLF